MRHLKFLTILIIASSVSLLYVHQEIELVKCSYLVQSNQDILNDLLDQNRILKYNVIALKAPSSLEMRLEASDVKLVMPERRQVVRVASLKTQEEVGAKRSVPQEVIAFLKFFALDKEAVANPID